MRTHPPPPAVVQGQDGWDRVVGPTAGTSIPDSGLGMAGCEAGLQAESSGAPAHPPSPQPLPSPQRPLPGQYSQEAQETEEEEQGLDSRFPDGYQDRLCQARRPPCGRVDEAASPAGPQPHPPAPRWTAVPGLPGSPHSPDGGPHVPASPHPATCPPSSWRRGHSFACGRGGGPPRAAPGHPLCSETLREMCWEPRAC